MILFLFAGAYSFALKKPGLSPDFSLCGGQGTRLPPLSILVRSCLAPKILSYATPTLELSLRKLRSNILALFSSHEKCAGTFLCLHTQKARLIAGLFFVRRARDSNLTGSVRVVALFCFPLCFKRKRAGNPFESA